MAIDDGLLDLMREDLADLRDLREIRMFGGICMMRAGHMLCGIHRGGALYRVGKANMAAALAIPGARPMEMSGRRMGGFVEIDPEAMGDDAARALWLRLACDFTDSLPPKSD